MAQILKVDDLIAAYGRYYREGVLKTTDLTRQIMTQSDLSRLFNMQTSDETRIHKANMTLTRVLQAFDTKFKALGVLDFKPHIWDLERVKINAEVEPDTLAQTALDFYVQKGVDRKEAPIIQVIASYLIDKAKEDMEELEIFHGKGQIITGNNPSLPGESLTGLLKKFKQFNTDGLFADFGSVIAMGAVPTDPVQLVEYLEDYYWSIPEKFRGYIKWISVRSALETTYKEGFDTKYNTNYAKYDELAYIARTKVAIVGSVAQNGSDHIWTSIPDNCLGRIKNPSNKEVFDLGKKDIYLIQMATDWYEGYDFINPRWIWNNGQGLA